MTLRVSGIINESIVDGPGIRLVIFAQGCERRCPGCHNPETHPLDGGREIDITEIHTMIKANPLLRGVTFSGGEPFLQARAFAGLARLTREAGLDVVVYSGYTIEEILELGGAYRELLDETDILIDGAYIEAQRTLDASYKGSANQRIIDVPSTLKTQKQN